MAKAIPFLLCRYELYVNEEPLDAIGQFEALTELQGTYYPHGKKAAEEGRYDSVVMRPRKIDVENETVLTWSVGQLIGARVRARYDGDADEVRLQAQEDDSIKYADFVAVPSLGALAVDDRSGDMRLGGRHAANRFRAIFRQLDGADANVILATEKRDIERAFDKWRLTSFMFTVRPYNPHPPSDLARDFAEAMKRRGIGKQKGAWEAAQDGKLNPKADDEMQSILDLSDAGYGQVAVKGYTPEGHAAQIKKPQFYEDQEKNLKAQERPREMRVSIEVESEDDPRLAEEVARALIGFYGN